MAELHTNLSPVVARLLKYAEERGPSWASGQVRHLADEVQHKLEAWHAAVDAKLEDWENGELHAASQAAFNAYREAVNRAHIVLKV